MFYAAYRGVKLIGCGADRPHNNYTGRVLGPAQTEVHGTIVVGADACLVVTCPPGYMPQEDTRSLRGAVETSGTATIAHGALQILDHPDASGSNTVSVKELLASADDRFNLDPFTLVAKSKTVILDQLRRELTNLADECKPRSLFRLSLCCCVCRCVSVVLLCLCIAVPMSLCRCVSVTPHHHVYRITVYIST